MKEDRDRGSGMRTVALLKLIAEGKSSFTLSDLADRAGLPRSSVHRLLQPLLAGGLVERAGGQAYRVGAQFLRISALVMRQADVARLARPILQQLWAQWEETCSLCVYSPAGHIAIVAETLQTPHPLRFVIEPLQELSLVWGSLGRAILAFLPETEAAAALGRPGIAPLSGLPNPSAEELADILSGIRSSGVACYRNEVVDAAGVAAPVFRDDGSVLGSLGITAPARRLKAEMVDGIAESVKAGAQRLSALLGYTAGSDGGLRG
ncbi:IclR family transcriptional regulator [Sphingobium nicotianae]|uniref:IclR family transcriptional regulator n=1 Tax=Sphingobium nicotianae TaxID=2782607 RepID=A0A9X1DEV9_9SPHN|nr:IclR family transcriptional regulator [Sphingobium nicotianae]